MSESLATHLARRLFSNATAFLVLCLLASSVAQARQGPLPYSRTHAAAELADVAAMQLPAINVQKRLDEDAGKLGAGPLRIAIPTAVNITPATDGSWESMADGTRLWRMRFETPGATDMNVGFTRFHLPAGASLYVLSGSSDYYEGPYTADDHKAHGQLWVPMVPGSEAIVELRLPPRANPDEVDLTLSQVASGYRDLFGMKGEPNLSKQGSCNINTICPEGDAWRDQIRSVVRYTIAGVGSCTGTLMNDQPSGTRNYILTAAHCGVTSGNAASIVTYWKYEAPVCATLSGGSLAINQTGANFRAVQTDVDMGLFELDNDPPAAAQAHYAGWDRSLTVPSGSVGIHHPSADEKAISFNDDPLMIANSCIGGLTPNTHWQLVWEQGTTEPGSSGSGLWNSANGKLVGFLSGGLASCSNPGGSDCYGRFSVAWDGFNATNRLRDWLDPNGTNAMMVDGVDASSVLPPAVPALAMALDVPSRDVGTTGDANWFSQSGTVMVGASAAQSDAIGHNQHSYMATDVVGPTDISFYWRVSSEQNFDFLRFKIDGVEQARISGTTGGWQMINTSIPAGTHRLSWLYAKDHIVSAGSDAGWVDGLVISTDGPSPDADPLRPDLNGDGMADILLRDAASGRQSYLQMNSNIATLFDLGDLPLEFKVVGVADLGGNGQADVVLRHTVTGQIIMFELDGTTRIVRHIANLVLAWDVVGLGDLNGDGRADLVLRNKATGQFFLFQMNNNVVTPFNIGRVSPDWDVVGIGDLNGDKRDDIVIRNRTTGQLFLLQMNNNIISYFNIGGLSLVWSVVAIGDVNDDGRADLILRNNSTGQLFLFQMNNHIETPFNIGALDLVWAVLGAADFNGDGRVDLLLRHTVTGELRLNLMNNNVVTALVIGALSLGTNVDSPMHGVGD